MIAPTKGKSKRIDHAKAAGAFIAKTDHVAFHDKRLWDLRGKRDAQAHGMPEWETLRDLAWGLRSTRFPISPITSSSSSRKPRPMA